MADKKKKHGFRHSHVEWHKDGSATVHHQHENPEHDSKHAAEDVNAVHDSLEDHIGEPNPQESDLEAGQHGIPDEHAQAAGIPTMPQAGQ